MGKSADAFRTISEVSDWLGVPAHVLRFWETRFAQVKPVKRAGGRRYYRPSDMELLGGIRKLLHDDGLTIRGVQKILREKGVRHVCEMSPPVTVEAPVDAAPAPQPQDRAPEATRPAPSRTGQPQPDEVDGPLAARRGPESDFGQPDVRETIAAGNALDGGRHLRSEAAAGNTPAETHGLQDAGHRSQLGLDLHDAGAGRVSGSQEAVPEAAEPADPPRPRVGPAATDGRSRRQPAAAADGAAARLRRVDRDLAEAHQAAIRSAHQRVSELRDRIARELDTSRG